jgi:hypothetical protein
MIKLSDILREVLEYKKVFNGISNITDVDLNDMAIVGLRDDPAIESAVWDVVDSLNGKSIHRWEDANEFQRKQATSEVVQMVMFL